MKRSNQNDFTLDVYKFYNLHLILTDKEVRNPENKDFIKDLKELSTQEKRCFIVFDKKDVTLKIDIDEVEEKMSEQEFDSKIDMKINDEVKPKDIIKMLNQFPKHLELRLEADNTDQMIKLMKCDILIGKLKEKRTIFVYKGIEIEPRIIKSKMDGKDLRNEVKEIKAKKVRLNMDCDK